MKVLVTGDRDWKDKEKIKREIEQFPIETIIIHGAARGADSLAEEVATSLGLKTIIYPALWNTYGKAAGYIRNRQMIKEHPDVQLVLAFHSDLKNSKGTRDMVSVAKTFNIPVKLVE